MRKALGATKEDECRLGVHRIANVSRLLLSISLSLSVSLPSAFVSSSLSLTLTFCAINHFFSKMIAAIGRQCRLALHQ